MTTNDIIGLYQILQKRLDADDARRLTVIIANIKSSNNGKKLVELSDILEMNDLWGNVMGKEDARTITAYICQANNIDIALINQSVVLS